MGLNSVQKVLITGSNGLLGQKLVYKLLDNEDFSVVATSRGDNRLLIQEGYKYYNLDISSKSEVEKIFEIENPDIIINTAAITNVDLCELDNDLADLINYQAVTYLADEAKNYGSFFIHISTDFIFDGRRGPYREKDQANPLNFYGLTKLKSEEYIKDKLIDYSILRTILVYGTNEDKSKSNIVLWAKKALENGDEIRVVDDQFRMPTLAEDLADACIASAESKIKGIFHISGRDYMSIYELVEKVAEFWNLDFSKVKRISTDQLDQPAKRPAQTGFVLAKSMGILGYNPRSFEQGLEIVDSELT